MTEVVKVSRDGRRRVVIVRDEEAHQPELNGYVLHKNMNDPGGVWTCTAGEAAGHALADDLNGVLPERASMLTMYLNGVVDWHDFTSTTHQSSDLYRLVITHGHLEEWGTWYREDLAKDYAREWQSWLDDDVYGIVLEELVEWTSNTFDGIRVRFEWEQRTSVWGFYGIEWAREAAAEEYADELEEKS